MKTTLRAHGVIAHGGACPDCGKVRYASKADAKAAARRMPSRVGRLHAYRCGEAWHLGHAPAALQRGDISRDEITTRGRG